MALLFHSDLSKDFSSILNDADDYNVVIQVGENKNTKEFRAHSVILRARSRYFKSALSTEWVTKKNDMIMFSKPNITPIVFDIVLKYIYSGVLNLENCLSEDIFELLIASDELNLEELFEPIQNYLIKRHKTWIQKNFDFVHRTVFYHVSYKVLQDFCLDSICAIPQPFFISTDFLSLDKDILYYLLGRDLQIDEIKVWDFLIKWGIEQTPCLGNMNSDRTEWNNEDSIIPNNIYEEIEEFCIRGTLPKTITLPPLNRIESNIIRPKFISRIINWIDKKDKDFIRSYNDALYKFDLIHKGSRDGMSNESVENKCNFQESILFLIKCQITQKMFGGYTPVGLYYHMDHHYMNFADTSFIIYYDENDDMKLCRLRDTHKEVTMSAIFNFYRSHYVFAFETFYTYRSFFADSLYSTGYRGSSNTIEEIEVFKVVKR
ncbi:hypothetical protein RclHR1_19750001 [Rhizophagus clarus]|uniref:BTB domain-containing protein n=1 Tax=Rhizophagus clarus TaxID=94130 RepID=A0A2Z6QP79_9GLOM|nr:hypothetical protein RclHR1_19750001 [Rhizophagus clarus]GES81764.1 hypothetical protein GLOIN_2v1878292 [Rhizophagus clarus]